jgi:hypothetical protein
VNEEIMGYVEKQAKCIKQLELEVETLVCQSPSKNALNKLCTKTE